MHVLMNGLPRVCRCLGGVIDVSGRFGLVQIISYSGRFPAAIEDAVNVDDGVPVKAALRGPM